MITLYASSSSTHSTSLIAALAVSLMSIDSTVCCHNLQPSTQFLSWWHPHSLTAYYSMLNEASPKAETISTDRNSTYCREPKVYVSTISRSWQSSTPPLGQFSPFHSLITSLNHHSHPHDLQSCPCLSRCFLVFIKEMRQQHRNFSFRCLNPKRDVHMCLCTHQLWFILSINLIDLQKP